MFNTLLSIRSFSNIVKSHIPNNADQLIKQYTNAVELEDDYQMYGMIYDVVNQIDIDYVICVFNKILSNYETIPQSLIRPETPKDDADFIAKLMSETYVKLIKGVSRQTFISLCCRSDKEEAKE
jgi:hypothetical protein